MSRTVDTSIAEKEFKPSYFWGRIDFFGRFIAIILSMLGGALALWTLHSNQSALKDQRAFEIIALYETPETQRAFVAMSSDIRTLLEDLGDNSKEDVIGDVIYNSYMEYGSLEKRADFLRLWYLLKRVSHCHSKQSCNQTLLEEYFCDYAVSFWKYFEFRLSRSSQAGELKDVEQFFSVCGTWKSTLERR